MKRNRLEASGLGVYNFTQADAFDAWRTTNSMDLHGHTLVWRNGNPAWLMAEYENPAASIDLITDYCTDVATHFAGRVMSWDVANEVFSSSLSGPRWHPCLEYERFGQDYIEQAFYAVQAADPTALRVLNQNLLYTSSAANVALRAFILDYLEDALGRGVPIQAIGIQCHLEPAIQSYNWVTFGQFIADLRARGLEVIISELSWQTPASFGTTTQRGILAYGAIQGLLGAFWSNGGSDLRTWGLSWKFTDYAQQQAEMLTTTYEKGFGWLAVARSLDALSDV